MRNFDFFYKAITILIHSTTMEKYMKKLIILLIFLLTYSSSVLGNKINFLPLYSYQNNNYNIIAIHSISFDNCNKNGKHFNQNQVHMTTANCITMRTEINTLFQNSINKENDLTVKYSNLQFGLGFDTNIYNLGNGQKVKVYKPKIKANFKGEFPKKIMFNTWKFTLNTTTVKKLFEENLPKNNLFYQTVNTYNLESSRNNNTLKERIFILKLILTF